MFEEKEEYINKIVGYFDAQVLSSYQSESEKYEIENDNFEGRIILSDNYYDSIDSDEMNTKFIDIRFGYRTLKNGELAIAVWLPDLVEKSKGHLQRWQGFHLKNPNWINLVEDHRFNLWIRRYLEGDWDVENGPNFYLSQTLRKINFVTSEKFEEYLFIFDLDTTLKFPFAQNTHRYQDAHKELYGYIIDGLNKECIKKMAGELGVSINVSSKKTVKALREVLPEINQSSGFVDALKIISDNRRKAAHGVRPQAERFPAFEKFTEDLELCLSGMKDLLQILEQKLNIQSDIAMKRHQSKNFLPKISKPSEPHYSINHISEIVGKTIENVKFGDREEIDNVHMGEAILIHFTDGSILGIQVGSNARNLADIHDSLTPEDFHTNFELTYVPPLD